MQVKLRRPHIDPMASGSRPADAVLSAVRELFEKSGGARYGLTITVFGQVLEQVAVKYAPGAAQSKKLQLWQELRYREKLYDISRGITKEDSSARDLADSVYADLYGTSERQGQRLSRLSSYMGRGSLEGWLRTVLAQEFINRYRKQKRLVSLEEQGEEGVQFATADHPPQVPADGRLGAATDEALDGLAAEDRLGLAAYYLDNRTLTEIGRMIGVHESTISRRLEKLLKAVRRQIVAGLQARGMDRNQAEEALEADVRYIMVDVKRKLQEKPSAAFQENKGSD